MACPAPHDKTAHGTNGKKLQERGRKVRESATCPSARVGKRAMHAGKRAKSAACASAQSLLRESSDRIQLHLSSYMAK